MIPEAGLIDTIRQIHAGPLSVGYAALSPADGAPVVLLHGWPCDIHSDAEVAPLPAADVIALMDALRIDKAVIAGYDKYRRDFNKLIWRTASPQWHVDDATCARSAAAFDNPDHVAIVIHNYRWRLGLAEGEAQYDDLEKRLAAGPLVTVPAITLEGDANGAPHADPASYARKFTGRYVHRLVKGAGHKLPQEAPQAFAAAVAEAAGG